MAKAKSKSVYVCSQCAYETSKWLGRCPSCEAWNSLGERAKEVEPKNEQHRARSFRLPASRAANEPKPLSQVSASAANRRQTSISELDRVLGGGLVPGSLVLVGGDPGIGKSTLLLQALAGLAPSRTLYITGEESPEQVKLRATRLGVQTDDLLLLAETKADRIAAAIEGVRPAAAVVDSIQTIYDPEISSAPGSVVQIREVAARLLYLAKSLAVPVFLVGHVTKGGELAGPRVLEHMVDTVLYFESSAGQPFRILRAHKNRFGSTNEIGVFEMRGSGLEVVLNPSALFLAERPQEAPGSVVLPAIEGTRPVLVEVQALVAATTYGTPRRTCLGIDNQRAAMLVAVLERSANIDLLGCDIFVNVAGGMHIMEPAADLAVAAALVSSHRRQALDRGTALFGEIGLAGELRAVTQPGPRLSEAAKLGFTTAVIPQANTTRLEVPKGIEVVGVSRLDAALAACFGR